MGKIVKLPDKVVRRIAAGEILVRPVNAVKELLENSLDAGATTVSIHMIDGGIRGLVISDNGCGIDKDDLGLLCERHATSKLTDITDLSRMQTFGFRGEALASIALVSRITVKTRTLSDTCGWRANYINGQLQDLQAQAAVPGTILTVDDLFYAFPEKQKTFLAKSADEYHRVMEMVSRYALDCVGRVGISLLKGHKAQKELMTTVNHTAEQIVGIVWGEELQLNVQLEDTELTLNDQQVVSMRMIHSNAHYKRKEPIFIIFINGRLIDWPLLTQSIKAVYSQIVLSGWHPWFFVSLKIPAELLDVNVSPTKNKVTVGEGEKMIEWIMGELKRSLTGGGRVKHMGSPLISLPSSSASYTPSSSNTYSLKTRDDAQNTHTPVKQPHKITVAPYKRVYSDYRATNIQQFFPSSPRSDPSSMSLSPPVKRYSCKVPCENTENSEPGSQDTIDDQDITVSAETTHQEIREPAPWELTSIQELRSEYLSEKSAEVSNVLRKHVMVGCMLDGLKTFIQFETCLMLVDTLFFAREYFHFRFLFGVGLIKRVSLPEPLSITLLLKEACDKNLIRIESDIDKDKLLFEVVGQLNEKSQLLGEYFSLVIKDDCLIAVPFVIKDPQIPLKAYLGVLLFRLIVEVKWDSQDEKVILQSVCTELASAYSHLPPEPIEYVKNKLFPAFKMGAKDTIPEGIVPFPSRLARNGHITLVTDVHSLYKTFDRC